MTAFVVNSVDKENQKLIDFCKNEFGNVRKKAGLTFVALGLSWMAIDLVAHYFFAKPQHFWWWSRPVFWRSCRDANTVTRGIGSICGAIALPLFLHLRENFYQEMGKYRHLANVIKNNPAFVKFAKENNQFNSDSIMQAYETFMGMRCWPEQCAF